MSTPSPTPERRDAVRAHDASRPGGSLVAPAQSLAVPSHGPPGLGGLLMVVGGALCVAGGVFIALGAQALVTISPQAATVFLKGTPLVAGGVLVAIGATVRRALARAYAQGVAAGRDGMDLPGTGSGGRQLQAGRSEARDR